MKTLLIIAAAVVALLFVPLVTNAYTQYVLNLVLVYIVIGSGLNLLLGYGGQFAFASAALMGVGAYTTVLLMGSLRLEFWLALPIAGFSAAVIGSLAAIPAMRMKSVYLGLVTLAFAEVTVWVILHWTSLTGGSDGLSLPAIRLLGYRISGDHKIFYINLATATVMVIGARLLLASPIGRAFVAIRENEIVARCNGINIAATKFMVFAISAFFAGVGGGLYALTVGFVQPETFGMAQTVLHFSLVVIGGLGSLAGPVLGAALVTIMPEVLRDFQGLQEIIYGALLVVFVIYVPAGLAGFLSDRGWLPREILTRNWGYCLRSTSRRRTAAEPAVAATEGRS